MKYLTLGTKDVLDEMPAQHHGVLWAGQINAEFYVLIWDSGFISENNVDLRPEARRILLWNGISDGQAVETGWKIGKAISHALRPGAIDPAMPTGRGFEIRTCLGGLLGYVFGLPTPDGLFRAVNCRRVHNIRTLEGENFVPSTHIEGALKFNLLAWYE